MTVVQDQPGGPAARRPGGPAARRPAGLGTDGTGGAVGASGEPTRQGCIGRA
jgi:hypothetical protein